MRYTFWQQVIRSASLICRRLWRKWWSQSGESGRKPPTLDDPGETVFQGDHFRLSWSAVNGATKYLIERASDAAFSDVSSSPHNLATTLRAQIAVLLPGEQEHTWHYRVRGMGSDWTTSWSNVVDVLVVPNPVPAPTIVPALSVAAAEIEWHEDPTFTATSLEPNADAILFSCSDQPDFSRPPGSFHQDRASRDMEEPLNFVFPTPDGTNTPTTYYCKARAQNINGSTENSEIVTVIKRAMPVG